MRRWVCVIALLFGFTGDRYALTLRATLPVPIERPVEAMAGPGFRMTAAWWRGR